MNVPVSYDHDDPTLGPSCETNEDVSIEVADHDIQLANADDIEARVARFDAYQLIEFHACALLFDSYFLDTDDRVLDGVRRAAVSNALRSVDLSDVYAGLESEEGYPALNSEAWLYDPEILAETAYYDPGPSMAAADDGL